MPQASHRPPHDIPTSCDRSAGIVVAKIAKRTRHPLISQSDPQRVAGRFEALVCLDLGEAKAMPDDVDHVPALKGAAPMPWPFQNHPMRTL